MRYAVLDTIGTVWDVYVPVQVQVVLPGSRWIAEWYILYSSTYCTGTVRVEIR
jgi:hypothetical protein